MLAIATPAALQIASKTETIPILGTAITDYVEARLAESNEKPGYNISGTSDMNPIADQIALLRELVPAPTAYCRPRSPASPSRRWAWPTPK